MQMRWCWRCKMEVPMLETAEEAKVHEIMARGPEAEAGGLNLFQRLDLVLQYYNEHTGWNETIANAVMHHMVNLYGPPCEQCGKPYRTDRASFCAACGHRRPTAFQPLVISFDLDDTLIPGSIKFETEPTTWWQRLIGVEPIRQGTKALFHQLQAQGHSVCIYTTSLRPPARIRRMLATYGITVDQIINLQTHYNKLGADHNRSTKYPPAFSIDLHIDDSKGVAMEGKREGFDTFVVAPGQTDWAGLILAAVNDRSRTWKQR